MRCGEARCHGQARQRLGMAYAAAALAVGYVAAAGGGGLWLLWLAASLALLAVIYLVLDAEAFEKRADGSLPLAVRCLLGPYLIGAWLNSRWWTRRLAAATPVAAGVLLGRLPTRSQLQRLQVAAIVDVCAELPCPTTGVQHAVVPMLDLVPPDPEQIERASLAIVEGRSAGPVLVCCALGFARSALVVAAWLLRAGIAASPAEAAALVLRARPGAVLGSTQIELLSRWRQQYLLAKS